MKTNFKKVWATLTTIAIIGAISATALAADQTEKKSATFNYGDENSAMMQQSVITIDENGNILDKDGNVIGNIKAFSANTEDMTVKAIDENGTTEGQNYSISITDKNGNIFDTEGNIIGNTKDFPATPEDADGNAELSTTDGNTSAETQKATTITVDDDGNIIDENGNIIGNVDSL